jgi:hypothetical protein
MKNNAPYGFKIESNIPNPTQTKRMPRIKRIMATLVLCKVGDSFVIPRKEWKNTRNYLNLIPRKEAKEIGMRVTGLPEGDGVRIWRLA